MRTLVLHPEGCIVLVPFLGAITQECEASLRALESIGYKVERVGGYSAIDQGRNQMATDALRAGYKETMWIDSDIAFSPLDVDLLRRSKLDLVAGIYPVKGKPAIACHVLRDTKEITFGPQGGLLEIQYAACGFLLVRREVYETMHRVLELPVCNLGFGSPMIPFFAPTVVDSDRGLWYLAEDYAFCHRAKQCGYKVFADSRIRLNHIGRRWSNDEVQTPRHTNYKLFLNH